MQHMMTSDIRDLGDTWATGSASSSGYESRSDCSTADTLGQYDKHPLETTALMATTEHPTQKRHTLPGIIFIFPVHEFTQVHSLNKLKKLKLI